MVYRSEISNTLGSTVRKTGCGDITQSPNQSEPASAIHHYNYRSTALSFHANFRETNRRPPALQTADWSEALFRLSPMTVYETLDV